MNVYKQDIEHLLPNERADVINFWVSSATLFCISADNSSCWGVSKNYKYRWYIKKSIQKIKSLIKIISMTT